MTKSIRRNKTFKTKKSRKNKNKSNLKGGSHGGRRGETVYGSSSTNTNGRGVTTDNPVKHLLQGTESCGSPNALVLNIKDIRSLHDYYPTNSAMRAKLNALITVRNPNSCNTYIINSGFFDQEEEEEEEEEEEGFGFGV